MLKRNTPSPAFAGIAYNKDTSIKKEREGICFSSSEAKDFNSFSSAPRHKKNGSLKPPKKDLTIEINTRTLSIAIISILAAIVLIVLVSALVASASKNIKFKNNTFLCYEDENGSYVVLKNGKAIRDVFADKITITPAADNSFAYITADTPDGYDVYLLEGKRPKLICDNAQSIEAYAELCPAVVYVKDDRSIYYYDGSETVITTGSGTASNIVISPDATAVMYNAPARTNPELSALFLYTTAKDASDQLNDGSATTVIPVTVSNKGKYALVYTVNPDNKDKKSLFAVLDGKETRLITKLNGYFGSVLYKNSDDTEIVFSTTDKNGTNHTYVLDLKKISKKKDNIAHYLGTGISVPQVTDERIVRLDTLKKTYFRNTEELRTFFLDKKYRVLEVADSIGEFDPDLKYFYFVDKQEEEKVLCRINIKNGKVKSTTPLNSKVEGFYVTEKGNVYYLDEYFDLFFYKNSQDKSIRIANNVHNIDFYEYKNLLFLEVYDTNGASAVYSSTEGSDHELAKFGGQTISKIPTLTNGYSKNTYAICKDAETDNTVIYYTSNGKSFKKVATTSNLVTK